VAKKHREAETAAVSPDTPAPGPLTVYVGTYTNSKNNSKGIYRLTFDPQTGELASPRWRAETKNPSFLAISPDRKYVYAVGEVSELTGRRVGRSTRSRSSADGSLKHINHASSGGAGPCYVSVDATGRNIFAANYGGGSICRLVRGDDGRLLGPMAVIEFECSGPNKSRQEKPHAHMIAPDPANAFVLATDLGTDQVMVYRLDPLKGLVPTDPPTASLKPGSGPRHFAFHPRGKFAFVINELSNTITSFTYDAVEGSLKEIDTVPTLRRTSRARTPPRRSSSTPPAVCLRLQPRARQHRRLFR
jgi:6-phosphogluconolactonase